MTRRMPERFFLLLSAMAFLLAACAAPQELNAPTATAVAALVQQRATDIARGHEATLVFQNGYAQATADARQAHVDEAANEWPVALIDPFTDNTIGWSLGVNDDDLTLIEWSLDNGRFLWQAECRQGFVWWQSVDSASYANFYMAVDVQQISGASSGSVGVVYRLTEEGEYYLFIIQNDGFFSVYQSTSEGWYALISRTPSSAIHLGEVNRLVVLAEDTHFDFLINGEWVAEVVDSDLSVGEVGLAIGLDNTGDVGEFIFDNLEVRALNFYAPPP